MTKKRIFILVLSALMSFKAFSQTAASLSRFYFSLDVVPPNMRWFDNKITKPTDFTVSSWRRPLDVWNGFPIAIGFKVNKKTNLELGYFNMSYWNGVKHLIPSCTDSDFRTNEKQEQANHIFARVYHTPFQFKILNDPLKFYFGLGYAFAHSSKDGFGYFSASSACNDNLKTVIVTSKESTTDLTKNFHLLMVDCKIAYEFSDYMSVTTSVGFNQGFKILGIYRMKYDITNEPTRYSESTTKGSNLYWSIGLHILPFTKR
jgi:hypothetical protein